VVSVGGGEYVAMLIVCFAVVKDMVAETGDRFWWYLMTTRALRVVRDIESG
jgi:hypothetical protein